MFLILSEAHWPSSLPYPVSFKVERDFRKMLMWTEFFRKKHLRMSMALYKLVHVQMCTHTQNIKHT